MAAPTASRRRPASPRPLIALWVACTASLVSAAPPEEGLYVGRVIGSTETISNTIALLLSLGPPLADFQPAEIDILDRVGTAEPWRHHRHLVGFYNRQLDTLLCSSNDMSKTRIQAGWIDGGFVGLWSYQLTDFEERVLYRVGFLPAKGKAANASLTLQSHRVLRLPNNVAGEIVTLEFEYQYQTQDQSPLVSVTEQVQVEGPGGLRATVADQRPLALPDGRRRVRATYEIRLPRPGRYTYRIRLTEPHVTAPAEATGQVQAVAVSTQAQGPWLRSDLEMQISDGAERNGLKLTSPTSATYAFRAPDGKTYTNALTWKEPPARLMLYEDFPAELTVTRNPRAGLIAFTTLNDISTMTGKATIEVSSQTTSKLPASDRRTWRFIPSGPKPRVVVAVSAGPAPEQGEMWPGPHTLTVVWRYVLAGAADSSAPPTILDCTPDSEGATASPSPAPAPGTSAAPLVTTPGVERRAGAEGAWQPAKETGRAAPNDTLRTDARGTALLWIGERTAAVMGTNSELQVLPDGVRLTRGRVTIRERGRKGLVSPQVETKRARIRPHGTVYSVAHDTATDVTTVAVQSGAVTVTPSAAGQAPRLVTSGQAVTVAGTTGPAATPAGGGGDASRPVDFGGAWTCDAPPYRDFGMRIEQRGQRATGFYQPTPGKIEFEGEITGRVLRLRWRHTCDGERGSGRLTLSEDGRTFSGGRNRSADPDAPFEGAWTGRRAPLR